MNFLSKPNSLDCLWCVDLEPNKNCLSCLYLNFQLGSSEEEEGKTLKYKIFIRTALVALCSIVPHWFPFKYLMEIFAAVQMRCLHPNVTNCHLTSLSQNTGWSWQGVGMGAKKNQLSHSFFSFLSAIQLLTRHKKTNSKSRMIESFELANSYIMITKRHFSQNFFHCSLVTQPTVQ